MNQPLICMTLTGKTLEENLKLVKKYEKHIDLVELHILFKSFTSKRHAD